MKEKVAFGPLKLNSISGRSLLDCAQFIDCSSLLFVFLFFAISFLLHRLFFISNTDIAVVRALSNRSLFTIFLLNILILPFLFTETCLAFNDCFVYTVTIFRDAGGGRRPALLRCQRRLRQHPLLGITCAPPT